MIHACDQQKFPQIAELGKVSDTVQREVVMGATWIVEPSDNMKLGQVKGNKPLSDVLSQWERRPTRRECIPKVQIPRSTDTYTGTAGTPIHDSNKAMAIRISSDDNTGCD